MDLRRFIELLEREGELARVRAEIDPYLEMAEIADRASKAHGPALLFERPVRRGGPAGAEAPGAPAVPVLMNQLGSYRRLELALGAPLEELAQRIAGLLELQVPSGLVGKVRALGQLKELASFTPKAAKKGAFTEVVVEPPDLTRLPVLTTWPGDGGPFITLPIVVTKDREGRRNAGMYRLQVFDERTTGMHWHVHHDGAANFREADGRFEVATARTGYDAGVMTQQFSPDLVVLDYMLPDINGNVVCKTIRENPDLAHIKVLIISGMVNPAEVDKLMKAGADEFIKKPFNIEHVIERVVELVRG